MMRPHFIFIHLYNDRSGSPAVLARVISVLHRAGYTGELLTSKHSGFLNAVPVLRRLLFFRRSDNRWLTLFWYVLGQVLLFFQCLRYWRRDVCFYVNTMMPAGAALSARLMGKPVIYHLHETSVNPPQFKRCLRFVIRFAACKVIFVSRFLRYVEGGLGKQEYLLYNTFSPPEYSISVKPGFEVLMVCSLKTYKGVDEFVQLASALKNNTMIRFTLVLNADHAEITRYFSGVDLPVNLEWFARQYDVRPFYERASVLLNLSRSDQWVETFGLTIVEAMSYGLPVIVPTKGGPAEIVRDGVEGYLLDCKQTEEIAARLECWLSNSECYQGFSERAKKRAFDFVPERFEKCLLAIIKETESCCSDT
ncbi:glycosyltransferase family 4 protein [Oceanimonas sp. CHS3-5]|uniref:glycosyltransferase family 4 protein n=1 Tax=Oceanimonas sp. CHS3-5 TaxID=3068186 RepID=UPI00273DB93C|nr:glycosyltransferase family 4 protein [Oceanimonas sp. CHS3-5]MDP5292525.1 glycosyltransferase family 4 protein [Oceanimonas sp. CHS3-5]